MYNGLGTGLFELTKLSGAKSFSISPENFSGAKGEGGKATVGTGAMPSRELGIGWKVSPSIIVKAGETAVLGHIMGEGAITHIWMTCFPDKWRSSILKMYWDGESAPSVSCPVGDFFCNGWGERCNVNSLAVTVNPAGGFNSYFVMPFKREAKIELVNLSGEDMHLYFQIDYSITKIDESMGYFHARWRRTNPVKYKDVYTIIDNIKGNGHYVGTYLAWQVNSNNWWGEGEIKFYMDGDKFPTICGTGTEDYFGGAWNFEHPKNEYGIYSTAYQGLVQAIKPDGLYKANMRFGMYRWHICDPVRFEKDLKVTIQALGWRSNGRYLPLQDDIASVAYWYQDKPTYKDEKNYSIDDYEIV